MPTIFSNRPGTGANPASEGPGTSEAWDADSLQVVAGDDQLDGEPCALPIIK